MPLNPPMVTVPTLPSVVPAGILIAPPLPAKVLPLLRLTLPNAGAKVALPATVTAPCRVIVPLPPPSVPPLELIVVADTNSVPVPFTVPALVNVPLLTRRFLPS